MSVHVIQYKDGKKMMIPVGDRETYLKWRDSEQNKRAEKKRMVQMNYSCLPNEDGSLKGATRLSSTVGMDIDHITDLQATIDLIMEKKDALGLLMMEKSASGNGLHVVFHRHMEMSQEENLRWASKLLDVEYDKGAKDIARVFFTPPSSAIIFLDDELFKAPLQLPRGGEIEDSKEPAKEATQPDASVVQRVAQNRGTTPSPSIAPLPSVQRTGEVSQNSSQKKTSSEVSTNPSPRGGQEGATAQNLRAFDLCVKEAGLSADGLDIWGEHNWHNNLMAVLSVGLPKLMSREQLMAVIRERVPNYSQTEDCTKLINYFYDNYKAEMGFMSTTLREINAKSQEASPQPSPLGEGVADTNEETDAQLNGYNPPEMPKKIPRFVELQISEFAPRFRSVLAVSTSVGEAALADHFRAEYLDGDIITPAMLVDVLGSSGSGKDSCTKLFNAQMKNTLQASDDNELMKELANKKLREKMKNSKDVPEKYVPKIHLFEQASVTSLLDLQTNIGRDGMLVGIFSEADNFIRSSGAAWSNLSVYIRKGWDSDYVRQHYISESSCNSSTPLNISLLMEGTPHVILESMFNDKNCENGLMQRFCPAIMPRTKRTFRPPKKNYLSADERQERDALIMQLYQKNQALGDGTVTLEMPKMTKAIENWFDELEVLYNDGELTEAEADLSHRCGQFMMRRAIPLVALYGEETKEIVNYCVWFGKYVFYNICYLFGQRVQENRDASNKLMTEKSDARKTAESILSQMPDMFDTQMFKEQRIRNGQSTEVKMILSRYCKNGKLIRVRKGVFRKPS